MFWNDEENAALAKKTAQWMKKNEEIQKTNVLIAVTNTVGDQFPTEWYSSWKETDKGNDLGQKFLQIC